MNSYNNKKLLTGEEIKTVTLGLLEQIDEVCQKNSFNYSLIGGTLLGAIRHQGFIPWDDDIDICMKRDEYESFLKYCDTHVTPFKITSAKSNPEYGALYAKVYDDSTILVDNDSSVEGVGIGVFIDVFPVDGLGNTKKEAVHQFEKSSIYREILNARNWRYYSRSRTHSIYVEPIRLFLFILSRFFRKEWLIRKIDKICLEKTFDDSNYVGIVSGSYRKKEIMEKQVFDEFIKLCFEKSEYMAIKNYDTYLRNIYGEYMKLPPAEKQISHHTFKAYRKEK